jgi:hypothetical protein
MEQGSSRAPMVGYGIGGFLLGSFLGYLLRPSAFLVGQLPLGHILTRGANFTGLDQMLVPMAQKSFNLMLAMALVGAAGGCVLGYFLTRKTQ